MARRIGQGRLGADRGALQRGAPGIADTDPNDRTSGRGLPRGLAGVASAPEYAATLSAENRRIVQASLAVLAVLSAGSLTGVAFSLYLVEEAPLLLIGLSPLGRHFVLVAPQVDLPAFLAVGVGRRLAFYAACYFLGRALGPVALVWLESRARGFARWVRWVEGLFARGGATVILLMAGPTTCTLAGIARMNGALFASLATVSLVIRLYVLFEFAELIREPIERLLEWIALYRLPGTLVILAAIAAWQLWKRVRAPAA